MLDKWMRVARIRGLKDEPLGHCKVRKAEKKEKEKEKSRTPGTSSISMPGISLTSDTPNPLDSPKKAHILDSWRKGVLLMTMARRAHAALGSRNRRLLRASSSRGRRWSGHGRVAWSEGDGSREMLIDAVLALELF